MKYMKLVTSFFVVMFMAFTLSACAPTATSEGTRGILMIPSLPLK